MVAPLETVSVVENLLQQACMIARTLSSLKALIQRLSMSEQECVKVTFPADCVWEQPGFPATYKVNMSATYL